MRQPADKAHGVRQHGFALAGKQAAARAGIQRREQFVFDKHVRARQRVEQRGFARIGIADERDRPDRAFGPAAALHPAALPDVFDFLFETLNPPANDAAIHLEFLFAGSPNADAALLTHDGTAARQSRQHVLKLGQFDLVLAFIGLRALRKNIENQLGAVNHLDAENFLQVDGLAGTQIRIEQDDVRACLVHRRLHLRRLSRPDQRRRTRPRAALHKGTCDIRARRPCEPFHFIQRFPNLAIGIGWQNQTPQHGRLDDGRPFDIYQFSGCFRAGHSNIHFVETIP